MAAAFPAGLALATVTVGPVLDAAGAPVQGIRVDLVPEWELIHVASGTRILTSGAHMVTDAAGVASVQVVRSDAGGLTRPNFTYQVIFSGPYGCGPLPAPYPLYVASTTVDLELAQPTSGSAGTAVQPTVSVAGLTGAITAAAMAQALGADLAAALGNPATELGAAGRAAFLPRDEYEAGGGGDGPGGYVHTQASPSASWSITNPLGRIPAVDLYVAGQQVEADVEATTTTVSVTFPAPTAGTAVLV